MSFYLLAAFLNAFVDLAHKITIQNVIFKTMDGSELLVMSQLVNAFILLPFVLFFIPSGELSDRKSKLSNMRLFAAVAVFLTSLITIFYALGLFFASFLATLALGAQSAFYSPAKYGYAKEISKNGDLAKTNSALQSVSIVSIILSTLFFSFLFEIFTDNISPASDAGEYLSCLLPIGFIMIFLSILEYLSLCKIEEQKEQTPPRAKISKKEKWTQIVSTKGVYPAMALLSLFFAISQSVMASFPSFAKEELGITSVLSVQAAMALSAVGVLVGSYVSGVYKNSRHRIAFVLVGMILYSICLVAVLYGYTYTPFFFLGVGAGFIIVALNTLIQSKFEASLLGSAVSISNLFQNILMLSFLGGGALAAYYGVSAKYILFLSVLIALYGAFYSIKHFPQAALEGLLAMVFGLKYSLGIRGSLPLDGRGIVLIGNHTSYIDWAFLQIATEEKIYFLIEKEIYDKPILKPFLAFFGALPIDKKHAKDSMKKAIEKLKEGGVVVIFPEGELTRDGSVGKFHAGFEFLAKKSDAAVFVFYLDGLYGSRFSKNPDGSYKKREVSVSFGRELDKLDSDSAREAVIELAPRI